ncbi:formimidoylglutamate deiminase [Glycomyces buryatensis]|uniref:Formimidoylglutamate deiminase n=1 Tax=Glycomyces buryatensis TaxID=2570927 RepID=A0A4S8Q6M5_9ACTN|nr:formimidoylglutamate deiminase [Glycomyces buryatensis]THV39780.1 formimidoylglutamate deiminase [Glycomyces buryatensis]
MLTYWAEWAWLPAGPAASVAIDVSGGRIEAVRVGVERGHHLHTEHLRGIVLPGFANAHSHAFHRALRGRTSDHHGGTFWTWREGMYDLAGRLDPDSYYRLARGVYAEMALAGITCVGEFHYLHHSPGGHPYADPNAMGQALIAAAADAGIRITLLDTLYLAGGFDQPLEDGQRRFGDGSLEAWYNRVAKLTDGPASRIGAAVHSVRAVPDDAIAAFACSTEGRPVHVHLSEQQAENAACRSVHGCTPTELLERCGLLGPDLTAVHATHLAGHDIELLRRSGTTVCLCPTTERDLADGLGPARALAETGVRLSLGTDSNAIVDMFEEARAVEMHERLVSEKRGRFAPGELLTAATRHDSLGWTDAGAIAPGRRADLVVVALGTARTAGSDPAGIIHAAGAPDITDVLVDGRRIVSGGRHTAIDAGGELAAAIEELSA